MGHLYNPLQFSTSRKKRQKEWKSQGMERCVTKRCFLDMAFSLNSTIHCNCGYLQKICTELDLPAFYHGKEKASEGLLTGGWGREFKGATTDNLPMCH